VGWVASDNLHLTLKFLGGVEPDRLDSIGSVLADVATGGPAFPLTMRGLGAFPSPTRPRVIWAGVTDAAEVVRLAARVEEALARLGFPREDRPFSAHVTLGRVREPQRDPVLAAALGEGAERELGALRVDRICLMRSELSPRGARYSVLGAWSLGVGART
jgi:2'-5' RNA ligase